MSFIRTVGAKALNAFTDIRELLKLSKEVINSLIYERNVGSRVVRKTRIAQVYFTAVQPVPLIILIGFIIGYTSVLGARSVGAQQLGSIFLPLLVLELGPIIAAFIVLGRTGGAVTVEIGNMVVAGEISALKMLGINPVRHIVWPRLVGISVATSCLSVILNATLLCAGALAAPRIDVYLNQLLGALSLGHLIYAPFKAFCFGVLIALIACHNGFSLPPLLNEVPKANIRTFIGSIWNCILCNMFLVATYYWWVT